MIIFLTNFMFSKIILTKKLFYWSIVYITKIIWIISFKDNEWDKSTGNYEISFYSLFLKRWYSINGKLYHKKCILIW